MSPSYWKRLKQKRLERSRKGVEARRRKREMANTGLPLRQTRVVEITIRDSHRTMTVLRLEQHEGHEGKWTRWHGLGKRPLGINGIAHVIGKYLQ